MLSIKQKFPPDFNVNLLQEQLIILYKSHVISVTFVTLHESLEMVPAIYAVIVQLTCAHHIRRLDNLQVVK